MVPGPRPQWQDIRTCGNSQCRWRGAMGRGHWANERDSEGVHGRDRGQHGVGTIRRTGQQTMCWVNSAWAIDFGNE